MSSLHIWSKFVNSRRALRCSGDRTHGSRENNGTVGVETAPRSHEIREARAVRTWQRLRRLGLHFNGYAEYARSCPSSLAESSGTLTNGGDGDSTTMLTQKGARKVVRKAGNNAFEAYRQLCPMYGASDQEGSTGLVRFQDRRRGRPSKRISGTGETIR